MWRGRQGRAKTWLHTHVGCTQSRLGTLLLSPPLPVNLNCSLLWSKCLAAREIASVAQLTSEGSSSPGFRWQSLEDATTGFCTPPPRRTEFLSYIIGQARRLIPRCVITQSSGKQRVIDNGDTGGQSERSSDSNKLTLCSPLRPVQHISLVVHLWSSEEIQEFCQHDA
jgi:hypothetical protein